MKNVIMQSGNKLELSLYGDIVDDAFFENDVTQYSISKQLSEADVNEIDVYISSYGGSVNAGLAIYNALRRHPAKVTTHCDGFACSIASVIFMAGDERIMNESSLLMIHNAWTQVAGNAEELRKQADDLEKITKASLEAYKSHSSLDEKEIEKLMDAETWILPEEAIEYGFATSVDKIDKSTPSQSAWLKLFEIIKAYQKDDEEEPEEPETEPEEPKEPESPETEEKTEEPEGEEPKEKAEKPAQKWSGFFNALL